MLSLELDRTGIANRREAAVWVVPSLDEGENRVFRFRRRGESVPVEQLAFQGGKEALGHQVIVAADSIGCRNISILEVLHGTITWLGR